MELTSGFLAKPRGSKAPPGYFRLSESDSPFLKASEPAMATNSCMPPYLRLLPPLKQAAKAVEATAAHSRIGASFKCLQWR